MKHRIQLRFIKGKIILLLAWCLISHAVDARAEIYEYAVDNDQAIIIIEIQNTDGATRRLRSWAKTRPGYEMPQSLFSELLFIHPSPKLQLQKEIKFETGYKEVAERIGDQTVRYQIGADENYIRVEIRTNGRISQRILTEPKLPFIDLSEFLYGGLAAHHESPSSFYTLRHNRPITLECENTENGNRILKHDGKVVARAITSPKYVDMPQQLALFADDNSDRPICRIHLRGIDQNTTEIGEHTAIVQPDAFVPCLEEPDQRNIKHQRSFEQGPSGLFFLTRHLEAHDVTRFIHSTLKEKLKRSGALLKDESYRHIVAVCDARGGKINAEIKADATLEFTDNATAIKTEKQKIRSEKRNVQYDRPIKYAIEKDTLLKAAILYCYDREVNNQFGFSLIKDTVRRFWQVHHLSADYYKYYISGRTIRATGMKERFLFDKTLGTVDLPLRDYWDRLRHRLRKQNERFDRELSASVDKSSGRLTLRYRTLSNDRAEKIVLIDLVAPFKSSYFIKPDAFMLEKDRTTVQARGRFHTSALNSVALDEVKEVFSEKFSNQPHARKTEWGLMLKHQRIHLKRQSDLAVPVSWEAIRSVLQQKYKILEEISFKHVYGNDLRCRFRGYGKQ